MHLHKGGFDAAGPWDTVQTPLQLEVQVNEGPAAETRLVCYEDAARELKARLRGEAVPEVEALATIKAEPNKPGRAEVSARCEVVAITTIGRCAEIRVASHAEERPVRQRIALRWHRRHRSK